MSSKLNAAEPQPYTLGCYTDQNVSRTRYTGEGTARFRDRFPALRDAGHFRRPEPAQLTGELWLSSIGLGTYLGEPDDAADRAYTEAIAKALGSGVNVLDTAINYRHQRSERNIGEALQQLIEAGKLQRDEVLVCTKAGYLSFDGNLPPDPRGYFTKRIRRAWDSRCQRDRRAECIAWRRPIWKIKSSVRGAILAWKPSMFSMFHNPESQLAEISRGGISAAA